MNRPWRSELAVPGSNPRMIEKGLQSAADLVFLDLEDAVAPSEKTQARNLVAQAIQAGDWHGKRPAYRVNALDSQHFYRDLIDVVEVAGHQLATVVVPKVDRAEDVYVVNRLLSQLEAVIGRPSPIGIEAQIESAAGLINCEAIAAASPRIEALTFGPGDFAASAGIPAANIGAFESWDALYPGHRWHYAMSRIVIAAHAVGVRAIDGPYADFRDEAGLRRSCQIARALGFDGKWCIHPAQIEIVNEVFTPSADEIAWARRVLVESASAATAGSGSLAIEGKMIDRATIRMAERTLSSVPDPS